MQIKAAENSLQKIKVEGKIKLDWLREKSKVGCGFICRNNFNLISNKKIICVYVFWVRGCGGELFRMQKNASTQFYILECWGKFVFEFLLVILLVTQNKIVHHKIFILVILFFLTFFNFFFLLMMCFFCVSLMGVFLKH